MIEIEILQYSVIYSTSKKIIYTTIVSDKEMEMKLFERSSKSIFDIGQFLV